MDDPTTVTIGGKDHLRRRGKKLAAIVVGGCLARQPRPADRLMEEERGGTDGFIVLVV